MELHMTRKGHSLRGCFTGAAWLSSARAVRCWVKSRNERNPYVYLPARNGGNSRQTAGESQRKVGMTSSQYGPYALLHTCYNGWYRRKQDREVEQIPKTIPSSDWSLKFDPMKLESLVKPYQLRRLEYVPGPCTHRPSHHGSLLYPKSLI